MKVAVVGGAGAMGSLFGGLLAKSGADVTLVDVVPAAVDALNRDGLRIENKGGATETVRVRATTQPAEVGPVDLVIVFVKCYHTEDAVRSAAPLLGDHTTVLSLQNGWGNAPRIAALVGEERVMAGVTYHSGVLLGPAHVQHAGTGMTFIGELNGAHSDRLEQIAHLLSDAGLDVTPSDDVLQQIWSKLALNVCTLPTSALLRFYAGQLVEHDGTLNLMRALLREVVDVAQAQGIALDFDERWTAITGLLSRAAKGKSSMLQDVEKGRRTEIDVINGAIVAASERTGIPTPHNQTMVWLIKALEETF
jgi:2-dehydropantoate 2-reductase